MSLQVQNLEASGRLVLAGRPGDPRLQSTDRLGEVPPGISLVADHDLPADPVGPDRGDDRDLRRSEPRLHDDRLRRRLLATRNEAGIRADARDRLRHAAVQTRR